MSERVGLFDCCASPAGTDGCCLATFCPCVVFGQIQRDMKTKRLFDWAGKENVLCTAAAFYVIVGSIFGGALTLQATYGTASSVTFLLNAAAFSCERVDDFGEEPTCQNVTCDVLKGIFCSACGLSQARNQQLRAMHKRDDRDAANEPSYRSQVAPKPLVMR